MNRGPSFCGLFFFHSPFYLRGTHYLPLTGEPSPARSLRGPITARRPADAEVLCVRGAPGIEVFEVFDYEL